ncbi:DUF5675 family protein [Pseudodesulfovibrio sp.]|uniref:DUF5675 family protein n=1 Tax=unclassified Pseudodesulfovibrio TaxID=2661612 RepID=UPI003AFFEBAA
MIESMELVRIEKSNDGTFGVLRLDGHVFCVTLEPPDRGNAQDVSCIPAGRYRCRRVDSPHFGTSFEITDVPGRSHILLHAGNVAADTRGCVLLGREFGAVAGQRGVLHSVAAMDRFMECCEGGDTMELIIRELEGGNTCQTVSA